MDIRIDHLNALLMQGDALAYNEIIAFISEDKPILYCFILI